MKRTRKTSKAEGLDAFHKAILNAVPAPVFVKDREHRWVFGNDAFSRVMGLPSKDYLFKTDEDFFPRSEIKIFWQQDEETFRTQSRTENEEEISPANGKKYKALTLKQYIRTENDEEYLVGVIQDISEIRAREERLKIFFSMIETSRNFMAYLSLDGMPLFFNKALRGLGWKNPCTTFLENIDLESGRIFSSQALAAVKNGRVWSGECRYLNHLTGEQVPVIHRLYLIPGNHESGGFIGVVAEDIRERLNAEQSVIESARLASLGEMAAQIAHEINNPLAIISGKAQLIHQKLAADEPIDVSKLMEYCNSIEHTVDRLSKIVKGLKSLARQNHDVAKQEVNLWDLVDDVTELCSERFKAAGIVVKNEVSRSVELELRPIQIQQVLINLFNNAFDAVQNIPEKWISIKTEETDGFIFMSVTDSGAGIPEALIARLMEPFFSTKAVGMGTGLGLSISKSIIESHGGSLFYDKSSTNTRFVISLPMIKG